MHVKTPKQGRQGRKKIKDVRGNVDGVKAAVMRRRGWDNSQVRATPVKIQNNARSMLGQSGIFRASIEQALCFERFTTPGT